MEKAVAVIRARRPSFLLSFFPSFSPSFVHDRVFSFPLVRRFFDLEWRGGRRGAS